MGIPTLWQSLQPAFDPRVPLSHFVSVFHTDNGRPVRLAIDVYIWLIEVGSAAARTPLGASSIQALHARVRELIRLHVSFVFVFDGKYKPLTKNQFEDTSESQEPALLERFLNEYEQTRAALKTAEDLTEPTLCEFTALVVEFQAHLAAWGIPYLTAAGEAEAECARLQMAGVVDFVVTNDVDALIFGCTHVLRNFSRLQADTPAGGSPTKGARPNGSPVKRARETEYWVTPVIMDRVTAQVGLDRKRLLLLAVLNGGDYNRGVGTLGMRKTVALAVSGTAHGRTALGLYHPRDPSEREVDFALQFFALLVPHEGDYRKGRLPDTAVLASAYAAFFSELSRELERSPLRYFSRKHVVKWQGQIPSVTVPLLYLYPCLRPTVFIFKPGAVSFAELAPSLAWNLPLLPHTLHTGDAVERTFGEPHTASRVVGYSSATQTPSHPLLKASERLDPLAWFISPSYSAITALLRRHRMLKMALPETWIVKVLGEAMVLKALMAKRVGVEVLRRKLLALSLTPPLWVEMLLLGYTLAVVMGEVLPLPVPEIHNQTSDLLLQREYDACHSSLSMWLPAPLVRVLCPLAVEAFEAREARALPLRRRKPPGLVQKTTLDVLWGLPPPSTEPGFYPQASPPPSPTRRARSRRALPQGPPPLLRQLSSVLAFFAKARPHEKDASPPPGSPPAMPQSDDRLTSPTREPPLDTSFLQLTPPARLSSPPPPESRGKGLGFDTSNSFGIDTDLLSQTSPFVTSTPEPPPRPRTPPAPVRHQCRTAPTGVDATVSVQAPCGFVRCGPAKAAPSSPLEIVPLLQALVGETSPLPAWINQCEDSVIVLQESPATKTLSKGTFYTPILISDADDD